jgi:hypothetical protein
MTSWQEKLTYWKQLPHVLKYFRAEEEPSARLPQNFISGFLEVGILPTSSIPYLPWYWNSSRDAIKYKDGRAGDLYILKYQHISSKAFPRGPCVMCDANSMSCRTSTPCNATLSYPNCNFNFFYQDYVNPPSPIPSPALRSSSSLSQIHQPQGHTDPLNHRILFPGPQKRLCLLRFISVPAHII